MKASIIILTYNQLNETTKPCIASIHKNTNIDDFELVVVDNCSSDDIVSYSKELEKT
jgi:glycosyltransferase involved in cell wall biosynthesis